MRLVLYQPDIPQNLGSILRLCACFDTELHIIEPCGFAFDDKRIRRSGMDYIEHVRYVTHDSWEKFLAKRRTGRLILLTTRAGDSLYGAAFQPDDWLLFGRESAGAPEDVHNAADLRIRIPMKEGIRSLNVALSAAIALSEAVRQTGKLQPRG